MSSALELLNLRNAGVVFRNISKVGFIETLRYISADLLFDYRFHVDTINRTMLEELEISSPNKEHGNYYEGTNAYVFRKVMAQVRVDPARSCFVDFGSGKGKVMIMAAEQGFRKVIGVEFSQQLIDACCRNLEIYKSRTKATTEFEVVHVDAAEYRVPAEANVLYFYNPFDETLIEKVIVNIFQSMEASPREILILHLYPQGNMAFARDARFLRERETAYGYIFRLSPDGVHSHG